MKEITPYETSTQGKKEQVSHMFDDISSSYDKVNRFISLGLDNVWKARVVKLATANKPKQLLDLATGTADLPLRLAPKGLERIEGIDISPGMLDHGRVRVEKAKLSDIIHLQVGDSEDLPFEDNSFDAVTVSYGLRNFAHLEIGLREAKRVLKPGGVFVALETSVPTAFIVKQGYQFFTKFIMPIIGRVMSGDKDAYKYLSTSANNFPCGKEMVTILESQGFTQVKAKPQFFGSASIYQAFK